ncbi:MAG TPA: M20 family metallopeptidase [candidate division Zixibacteria bacterium]|nr:M20 family metallopeptidase [candidate division Zixibacteria bacterium]
MSTKTNPRTSGGNANAASGSRTERIRALAKRLHPDLIKVRRHLHQRPEVSFEEVETTKFLIAELAKLKLTPFKTGLPTGVVTELKGVRPGPTVAVRTDIDALPILEKNEIPFVSKIPGRMHACGHDVHMAVVLGTARLLSQMKDEIAGNVRFFFQHAEEMPPGGARELIAAGALKNPPVRAVLGLHVDPRTPVGKIGLRDGVTMASVDDVDITIIGKSGHAARPHDAVDAIAIAAEVVGALQRIVSRETDPFEPVVITVGQLHAGTARNVIAERAHMKATIRTLSAATAKRVKASLKRTVTNLCRARGARVEIDSIADYPPVDNVGWINRIYEQSFTELFGHGRVEETAPSMGGEDFACYLAEVPGAMLRLGVRNPKIGATENWHSDRFMVDEDAIYYGVALMASSALAALERVKG